MRGAERLAVGFALALAAVAASATADHLPARAAYTLAVVPQQLPLETHRAWKPFLDAVARAAGVDLHLKLYGTFEHFETELMKGSPDFAYLPPYHQLLAHRAQRYLPLVRDGSQPLTGLVVVRRDSPHRTVRDLDGATLAFPSPNALAASLYVRAVLAEQWKVRVRPVYVASHGNVLRHVILGKAAAGGVLRNIFEQQPAELRAELRILYETPGFAPHPLSAHPRVPEAARRAVKAAILRVAADPAQQALAAAVALPKPVAADFARDYRPLERLGLEPYVVMRRDDEGL